MCLLFSTISNIVCNRVTFELSAAKVIQVFQLCKYFFEKKQKSYPVRIFPHFYAYVLIFIYTFASEFKTIQK